MANMREGYEAAQAALNYATKGLYKGNNNSIVYTDEPKVGEEVYRVLDDKMKDLY